MSVMRRIVILTYFLCSIQTLEYRCKCCGGCRCCGGGNSNTPAPITEEDKQITPKVLIHLKLDGNKLNDIVTEVNKCSDNIAKIKKIIEYTADIDWANPMCPNTLMRWENNFCVYIGHFHLMLNNPYFVKFFLICDKIDSLHREDTYVLNAMCEVVKWCVERPSFNKNNMGSIDKIMKAFFLKEKDGEYFYCKKEGDLGEGPDYTSFKQYYHGYKNPETGAYEKGNEPHTYGSFQTILLPNLVNACLFFDFNIQDNDLQIKIRHLTFYLTDVYLARAKIPDILEHVTMGSQHFDIAQLSTTKRLLGLALCQRDYHFFVLVYHNGVWYNKNTLLPDSCGQNTIEEVQWLCDEIKKIALPVAYMQFDIRYCKFIGLQILNT